MCQESCRNRYIKRIVGRTVRTCSPGELLEQVRRENCQNRSTRRTVRTGLSGELSEPVRQEISLENCQNMFVRTTVRSTDTTDGSLFTHRRPTTPRCDTRHGFTAPCRLTDWAPNYDGVTSPSSGCDVIDSVGHYVIFSHRYFLFFIVQPHGFNKYIMAKLSATTSRWL